MSLLVAVLGAGLCLLAFLWLVQLSTAAPVLVLAGGDLQLVAGKGRDSANGVTVFAASPNRIVTVQAAVRPFSADQYDQLSWKIQGLQHGQELRLIWSTAASPKQVQDRLLAAEERSSSQIDLKADPDWCGKIVAIGLVIVGELKGPLEVERLELSRDSAQDVRDLFKRIENDWSRDPGWTSRSINFASTGTPFTGFSPVVLVALWSGFASLVFFGLNPSWRRRTSLAPYLMIWLAGWALLDLRWQGMLWDRLAHAQTLYADKTQPERWMSSRDRAFYPFVESIRGCLPDDPARILMLSSEADAYGPSRLKYHLLPHNVWLGETPDPSARLAEGDYLLILRPAVSSQKDLRGAISRLLSGQLNARRVCADPRFGDLFAIERRS
ncbi:hypothetical protein G3480_02715 [Thiorhodococcus mannitoliphagus]|uniref:Uncharacterized protein n=1 Tax=Thiorhodococcus mannitoliphagus TaxID=329406 RepID=A0A6P1DQ02_9GAMM|nr:hypothetical protein [Thiorhodococcus mannitoliphagus]